MKSCIWIAMLSLIPSAMSFAQRPANRNNAENGQPVQNQPGEFGGAGPRGFFGPRPNPMFSIIDADSDGVLTTRELRRAVSQLKKLDTDQDGTITLAEASGGGPGMFGGPMGFRGPGGDPAQFVDRMLENDKNGDGKLTADEVPENMRAMLEGSDTNRDGAIDRNELTSVAENMRARFRGPGAGGFPGGGPGFQGGGPGGFRGPAGFGDQPFDPTQVTGQLLQNDRNGDGRLTPDEVPPQSMGMLQGADRNGDGAIDATELQAVVRRMGSRGRAFGAGGPQAANDGTAERAGAGRARQRARDSNN